MRIRLLLEVQYVLSIKRSAIDTLQIIFGQQEPNSLAADKSATTPKGDRVSYVHVQRFSPFLSKQFPHDGALREALLAAHPHGKSSSP
jgi:hypothetical protein